MTSVRKEVSPYVQPELLPSISTATLKYDQAVSIVNDRVWDNLNDHTVGEALELWLGTLGKLTATNYRSGMRKLMEAKCIDIKMSLQSFALSDHESVVDRIKTFSCWKECTRQARAACYISFTGFLSRRFKGIIKKAMASKEGSSKTFFRVHEKVKSNAMTQAQWLSFFGSLQEINPRDCLIAKLILQGGKRVNEVLALQVQQIHWDRNEIIYKQSKTKGMNKETVITYPVGIMQQLREYIGDRKAQVFVTDSLHAVMINQLTRTFKKAGEKAGIPFKVTPHVLRASAVTFLKQQGFSDSDIMGVTGHASSAMVYSYDKSSRANNASKKVSLVS